MSAQHTRGPWTLNTQYADIEVRGPVESGVLIAVMSPWGVAADAPNPQQANARLIAAAPDLLAALKALHDNMHAQDSANGVEPPTEDDYRQCMRDAAAAIAKATGSAA